MPRNPMDRDNDYMTVGQFKQLKQELLNTVAAAENRMHQRILSVERIRNGLRDENTKDRAALDTQLIHMRNEIEQVRARQWWVIDGTNARLARVERRVLVDLWLRLFIWCRIHLVYAREYFHKRFHREGAL